MTRKPARSPVPMYDGDDWERLNDLRRAVQIAEAHAEARRREATATRRLGDDIPDVDQDEAVTAARAAFDAFVDEASERAEIWVLQPIGHGEFRELLAAHPPRVDKDDEGNDKPRLDDQAFGVNVDTFPMALLSFVDPEDSEFRTIAEPEFKTDADRKRALKRLSAGEFDSLWIRAFGLNRMEPGDPKDVPWREGTTTSSVT